MTSSAFIGFDSIEFVEVSITNRDPAPGSVDQPTTTNIYMDITDVGGITLSTVLIEVNVDGGGWEDAYVGSTDTFPSPYDGTSSGHSVITNGYAFTIDPDPDFGQSKTVQVRVTANGEGPVTYQFQTGVPPYISYKNPIAGYQNTEIDQSVILRIRDDGSGIDQDETLIRIDRGSGWEVAYDHDAGGFQSPFTGTYSTVEVGLEYEISIDHPDFPAAQTITIEASATDNAGNPMSPTTYSFVVISIDVTNESPAVSSTDNDKDGTVDFSVSDTLHNVTLSTVVAKINGAEAYKDSAFEFGYTGSVVSDGSGGYDFSIDPAIDFVEGSTTTINVTGTNDISGALDDTYTYDIATYPFLSVQVPTDGEIGVLLDQHITFTIDGGSGQIQLSLTIITVDTVVAYDGSSWQPGFSGTIVANGNGYDIDIDAGLYPVSTRKDIVITTENNLGHSSIITYFFVSTRFTGIINPITPIDVEALVSVDTDIIIDFLDTPTLVRVEGVIVYDGAGQAGWTATLVVWQEAERLILESPSDFSINQTINVVAETSSDSLTYSFNIGTTQITTTNDAKSPRTSLANTELWYGYVREDESGLGPGIDSTNVYLRHGNPLTAETRVVQGNIIDIGYDSDLGKFIILLNDNGKVMLITADPSDLPTTKVRYGFLTNEAKTKHISVPDQENLDINTFPALKYQLPDTVKALHLGSQNYPRELDFYDAVPEVSVVTTPYPEGNDLLVRITNITGSPEVQQLLGFNVIKVVSGYRSVIGFVTINSTDSYVDFIDSQYNVGARYSAQPVYKGGNGNQTIYGSYATPAAAPTHSVIWDIKDGYLGASDIYSYSDETFIPIKKHIIDASTTGHLGSSDIFYLDITGFGTIGIG